MLTNTWRICMLLIGLFTILSNTSASTTATPPFHERLATAADLQQLRQGGLVIFMRHAKTDNTRPDRAPAVDLNDCSTQRPLSDEGRQLAVQVGAYIRQAQIPHETPISSPMCRAKETSQLAFGHYTTDMGLTYSGSFTSTEKIPVLARTRQLLSMPVAQGTNRLLVAHAPNLMDIMGYFPKEGTLVIFQPQDHQGYTYLFSITPELWSQLLTPQ